MGGSPEKINEATLQKLLNDGSITSITGQTSGHALILRGSYNTGVGSNVREFTFSG